MADEPLQAPDRDNLSPRLDAENTVSALPKEPQTAAEPPKPDHASQPGFVAPSRSEAPRSGAGAGDRRLSVYEAANALENLKKARPQIEARDPALAASIETLYRSFWETPRGKVYDPGFKTELAHAVEDVEKITGPLPLRENLRHELAAAAATHPGLENEPLKALLRLSPSIEDRDLVTTLREKAADVAGQTDQNSAAIQNEVKALAVHVLTAARVQSEASASREPTQPEPARETSPKLATEQAPDRPIAPASASPPEPQSPRQDQSTPSHATSDAKATEARKLAPRLAEPTSDARTQMSSFADDRAASPSGSAPGGSTAKAGASSAQSADAGQSAKPASAPETAPGVAAKSAPSSGATGSSSESFRASAQSAGSRSLAAQSPGSEPEDDAPQREHKIEFVQERVVLGGVFGRALGAAGRGVGALGRTLEGLSAQQPQSPPQQSALRQETKQAVQGFEARFQPTRDEKAFDATNIAAQRAIDSINELRDAPGTVVLARIQEAAEHNPGGLQAVINGMKPGGAFQDLRQEYNAALSDSEGFGGAYNRAADALKQFGQLREQIIPGLASHPDPKHRAHFEKVDAMVGAAASSIPGEKPGESALHHLAEKAREIVEKVLDKVRSVFQPGAEATARPAPSPSPG